jgi:hypothetical protein
MKGHLRKRLILVLISGLIMIFLSTTVLAQTDININKSNIIRLGGDVTVPEKQVVENAQAIGGSVTVQPGARVTETAIAVGGNVFLKKNARIDGDAYAVGGRIIQEEGATIGGASGTLPGDGHRGIYGHRRWGVGGILSPMYFFNAFFRILTALVSAILGVVLLLWLPNFLPLLAATINQYPVKTGLWGLGGSIVVIALNIFLAVSLLGIPLIPLVSLVAFITTLLGSLGVALLIGQKALTDKRQTAIQQFLIGLLILTLIGLIPFLGGLFLLVVNILGLGAILAWKLGKTQPQIMA